MYATLTIEAIDFEQELIFTPEERYAELFLGNYLKGVGISSIIKTSSDGLIDTYTITFTDNTTTTFEVTNGSDGIGISNIELVSTVDKVKTYRITFTNSSTFEYTITDGADGRGIVSFTLISTVDKTKKYRLLYTDSTYVDINIVDGNDGNDGTGAYQIYVVGGGTLSEAEFNAAITLIPTHIADETIHHTIEELNEVYEPANANIQNHISDTNIHIDSSSELGVDINESTHSLLLWNGLKALKVTFARLKTWIGSTIFNTLNTTSKTIIGGINELDIKIVGGNEIINGNTVWVINDGKYINAIGDIASAYNFGYVLIHNNHYDSIVGNGSNYEGLIVLAFYSSNTPSSTSLISYINATTSYAIKEFNITIPDGCVSIGITYYKPTQTAPVASLIKRTGGIENEILQLENEILQKADNEDLNDLKETVDLLVTKTDAIIKYQSDFTQNGYYKSTDSGLTIGYNYISLPIIDVVEGQIIKWHKWVTNPIISEAQALCCYDNDGLPYNGVSARINYSSLTVIDYVSGEYEFVIPSNCSKIGVSYTTDYPVQDGANIIIRDLLIELTDLSVELINEAVTVEVEQDLSAEYYIKGESNIVYNPTKKIGIIAAGQSNIDGRNSYSDLPIGFINPNNKIHFCKVTTGIFSDFQVLNGGAGNDWSFDAIVYDSLTNTTYGNQSEIYVMKHSMGGTSIDKEGATDYHWTADYEYLSSETYSLLRTFEQIIRAGIASQGNNFDIKAFIWHQGEGDAATLNVANNYYTNLKKMLSYVRGVIGNPRLHFFCGNISNNNIVNLYKDVINAAYDRISLEDPYFHLVDMKNAVLEDSYHFNYAWSIYFGQKVYDLMIDSGILTGIKINPSEPS